VAYGPECLGDVLGDDAPVVVDPKPTRSPLDRAVGVALLVALVSTLAPWTRFGTGSGWLHGAWAWDVRWSMLAAIASLVGAIAWVAARPGRGRFGRKVCIVASVGSALGSSFAILNPPPFTKPALAPWIALAASVTAVAMLAIDPRERGRAGRGRAAPPRPLAGTG
jgi:hypothetical protein